MLRGDVGDFLVSKSMDSPSQIPFGSAFGIDVLLLGIFSAQHSVMARPWFKRAWTRTVPEAAGTEHLRTFLKRGHDRSVRLLAAVGRRCVEHSRSGGTVAYGCTISEWIRARVGELVLHQSLRLVWTAAGLALPSRQAIFAKQSDALRAPGTTASSRE